VRSREVLVRLAFHGMPPGHLLGKLTRDIDGLPGRHSVFLAFFTVAISNKIKPTPSQSLMETLPDFSAALAIPDRAALIFSAY
jgi:hypothetical protein